MPHRARLLGFAFASADFLFEIDTAGTIQFAAGAANDLVRDDAANLSGKPAGKLFQPAEGAKFSTFVKALRAGDRAGPFRLTLATGAEADLAMFRLPENGGAISCSLARPAHIKAATDAKTGLASKDGFMAAAAKAGEKDALTMVNVPGLPELCAQLTPHNADALMRRIGDSLKASGAAVTARISDTAFSAIAPATRGALGLSARIADAVTASGLTPPKMAETQVALQGVGLSAEQRLLALRYTIDRFAEKGKLVAEDGDISSAFAGMMDETQTRLAELTRVVGEGAFQIAYQPIADLETGKVSHYEALARFDNAQGTGDTVKFIEALGISNAFDLAVANKVLNAIEDGEAHIAFNISGDTIATPASFGVLAAMLAKRRKLAPRTLIEITETAAIADLESAAKAIAAIRAMGYRVGLDDFGAGAASVNYLHAFQVDFVKFDGAMIQKIGTSPRDDALLSGLAKLCGELGVTTIAEWIENQAMAKQALALGFDHGQGRFLGAPLLEIPVDQKLGRRKGLQESWG